MYKIIHQNEYCYAQTIEKETIEEVNHILSILYTKYDTFSEFLSNVCVFDPNDKPLKLEKVETVRIL